MYTGGPSSYSTPVRCLARTRLFRAPGFSARCGAVAVTAPPSPRMRRRLRQRQAWEHCTILSHPLQRSSFNRFSRRWGQLAGPAADRLAYRDREPLVGHAFVYRLVYTTVWGGGGGHQDDEGGEG